MGSVYSHAKIFRFPEKLFSLSEGNSDCLPPLHVRIKPTNVCNHRCRYCAYRQGQLQLGEGMNPADSIPREKMLEIVDDLVSMGVKAVTFSGGGEPFCYPHLTEAVRRLADSPVRFASLTNGSLLQGEAAELFAHHATWLRVSIDGWDEESYSAYRNVPPGNFKRLCRNLEKFKKRGGSCRLGVSIVVDRENATHLVGLATTLHGCGVDSIKISPCIVSNSGKENNAYHAPIFEMVKEQITVIQEKLGKACEIFDAYHTLAERFDKSYSWCPYLQVLPVIGADQRVYSCQDKAYAAAGLLGSIEKRRFKDFWHDGKEKFFRVVPSRDCSHHCVADAKNRAILDFINLDPEHLAFV